MDNNVFYWGILGKVFRMNFDGSGFQTLYDSGVGVVTGIAIDNTTNTLYWSEFSPGVIKKAPADGSGPVTTLFSGLFDIVGIDIDPGTSTLYFARQSVGKLFVADAGGSGAPTELVATGGSPTGVKVDLVNQRVYWANFSANSVERSNLNGSGREVLFDASDGLNGPAGIAIDEQNEVLFVMEAGSPLKRGNADGSGSLTTLYDISAIDFDSQGVAVSGDGKTVLFPGLTDIYRGSADGNALIKKVKDFGKQLFEPSEMYLDVKNSAIYVLDNRDSSINRLSIDFSLRTGLLPNPPEAIYSNQAGDYGYIIDFAFDPSKGHFYWADQATFDLVRANADGSGTPTIIAKGTDLLAAGVNFMQSLVFDETTQKLFWIDGFGASVMSINADGTGGPTLLYDGSDGLASLVDLVVSKDSSFLYMIDANVVKRGAKDGMGAPVAIVTDADGPKLPVTLGLDDRNGNLYIFDGLGLILYRRSSAGVVSPVGTGKYSFIAAMAFMEDADGDYVPDELDLCSLDSLKLAPGVCGCGVSDADSDGDGSADCQDMCSSDALKTAPGVCGCGVADTDSDGDGSQDCVDMCVSDALKTAPGVCGCGVADSDLNSNGIVDCLLSAEFFSRLSELQLNVKSLRPAGKNKKKRKVSKAARDVAKGALEMLSDYYSVNAVGISASDGSSLDSDVNSLSKAIRKALKIKSKKFRRNKKKALKLLGKLSQAGA